MFFFRIIIFSSNYTFSWLCFLLVTLIYFFVENNLTLSFCLLFWILFSYAKGFLPPLQLSLEYTSLIIQLPFFILPFFLMKAHNILISFRNTRMECKELNLQIKFQLIPHGGSSSRDRFRTNRGDFINSQSYVAFATPIWNTYKFVKVKLSRSKTRVDGTGTNRRPEASKLRIFNICFSYWLNIDLFICGNEY